MNRFSAMTALAILSLPAWVQADDSILPDVPDGVQAISLLGEELKAGDASERLLDNLAVARADYEKDPDDADNIIWLGRRLSFGLIDGAWPWYTSSIRSARPHNQPALCSANRM